MNDERSFERTARAWLEPGANQAPDRAIQAVLLAIETTPQERDLRIPWRFPTMNTPLRVGIAAVVGLLLLGAGIYLFGGSGPGLGGQPVATPTPAPTASPSPLAPTPTPEPTPVDTTGWAPFVSDRYGYEIAYPPTSVGTMDNPKYCPGCTPTSVATEAGPGTRDWLPGVDRNDWLTPAADRFVMGPNNYQVAVSGFSSPVQPGTTTDAWYQAAFVPCDTPLGQEAVTVDGYPGQLYLGCDSSIAAVVVGDRGYVFAEWQGDFVELLKGFLSTVRFTTVGPSPSASAAP